MQTSQKGSVVIISEVSQKEPNINPQLVKAIARIYHLNNLLCSGKVRNHKEIRDMEKLKDYSYITEVVNLRFLIKTMGWKEQRKLIL